MMRTFTKKPNFFRRSVFFIYVVAATLGFLSSPSDAADYNYPYRDPYIATATTAILSDDGATPRVNSEVVHVPGLPGRNQLPSLEGRGELSIALYRQSRPAPLTFILAGIGSNAYFGIGPYLASIFYKEGAHIVILPSPMSWNFALAASRSGAPGLAPDDARDLYEVMQKTLSLLRKRYDLKITAINLIGVSLGALQGAYLSVIDDDLIRHQLRSQEAEEMMHFMEGKYQIDAYALTPADQKPIEEVFDFLLRPWAPEPSRALGGTQ